MNANVPQDDAKGKGKGKKGKGKGKGKDKGKDGRSKSTPPGGAAGANAEKQFCIKFQTEHCTQDKCRFKHDKPKTAEEHKKLADSLLTQNNRLAKQNKKERARSQSPTPSTKPKPVRVKYCNKHARFLRKQDDKDCDGSCGFKHMGLEEIKTAVKKARDDAKAGK